MNVHFELPVSEAIEQERVLRINIPAAVAGGAAAAGGYIYFARHEKLPDALTEEVLGDAVDEGVEKLPAINIRLDENGLAKANDLSIVRMAEEQQLETFVLPLSMGDLSQTADEIHKSVSDYLYKNLMNPGSTTRIELEYIDGTFGVDPLQQMDFVSKTEAATPGGERFEDGLSFEAYRYESSEQTKPPEELSEIRANLQRLVHAKFPAGKVGILEEGEKVAPFTTLQYERLGQLAQDNGYSNVSDFLSAHYYEPSKIHDQIDAVLREVNILTDKPSVLVRVIEEFPAKSAVTIKGCRVRTQAVVEHFHNKAYDPAPEPLGMVTILGIAAAGIRFRQRRRVLDTERLRRLGLDGPAPSKEAFEAVRSGKANTRQKLQVLRYQKASELVDDKNSRVRGKRIVAAGFGVVLAGLVSVVGISTLGGEKPDEKPGKAPPMHIARDSKDHCTSSDMVAVSYHKGVDEEKHYFVEHS